MKEHGIVILIHTTSGNLPVMDRKGGEKTGGSIGPAGGGKPSGIARAQPESSGRVLSSAWIWLFSSTQEILSIVAYGLFHGVSRFS